MNKIEHPHFCIGSWPLGQRFGCVCSYFGSTIQFRGCILAYFGTAYKSFDFLEFLFTFACILHASGHLHELTNFGIDLTSILSLMISPQTSSKFSDYILLLGADSEGHCNPKMEGCDAKQNATFVPHPFIPLPTNIVFRMKRLFSIYMGYFSRIYILHDIPLLWTIKRYTVQSFMNGWTSHFFNVTHLCSPIFSEVFFRSQSKTWTFDALSCWSCWGTCLSGSWRWYRIQVKGGFSWGVWCPKKQG